jgi:hypothetical protein
VSEETWSVFFLLSPSPGAVFRFLERQANTGKIVPPLLYLSEPVAPHGFRVLFTPPEEGGRLEAEWGESLAIAFPRVLIHFWQFTENAETAWGYIQWEEGAKKTEFRDVLPAQSPLQGILQRLSGSRVVPPPIAWANRKGLPIARYLQRHKISLKEYATVAALDRKSLLVEDAPCLYRFATNPPAGEV